MSEQQYQSEPCERMYLEVVNHDYDILVIDKSSISH